ncbi:MAG: hypothetical protein AAGD43_11095, partial [Pseudomonadota bacterium]
MAGLFLDQHWIFDLAERDPERLLSMSDDEFKLAMADAGLDVDELSQQFALSVDALFARLGDLEG